MGWTWDALTPYLEYIPDPKTLSWNPCNDPEQYPDTEVQHFLSCLAKNTSMYIVANMGDKQPCNTNTDSKCPPCGHYQYNTNVAFDPTGKLVSRYHKVHLFLSEPQFSYPQSIPTYFETPWGRFGMFTCFDILFEHPAIDLVDKLKITNIAFPTAWMDALPLFPAIGFHSSFAKGLGINMLAANIHKPAFRFQGSGIYTPEGVKDFYYNTTTENGKLIIADVPVVVPRKLTVPDGTLNGNTSEDTFNSLLFHDNFTFVQLTSSSGSHAVCSNGLCCQLDYQMTPNQTSVDMYAFGSFRGLHTYQGSYFIEVCTLVKCENAKDRQSCGQPTTDAQTQFVNLHMRGHFSVPFIYPDVVVAKGNSQLALPSSEEWMYRDGELVAKYGFRQPLVTAALFARTYNP